MGCSPTQNGEVKIIMNNIAKASQTTDKEILIPQENNDPFLFYTILEFIKQSKHSSVYKVRHKKSLEIRIMKIYNELNESSVTKDDIKNQINILKTLSHPHIITLYEVFYFSNKIYLLYEYFPDGNLFDYISNNQKLNEKKSRQIIFQIINALNYCHLNRIILSNLSPEHIVIQNKTNKNCLWTKIIDFGAYNLMEKKGNNECNVITLGFKRSSNLCCIPPEDDLSEKTDIWSVGVIMYFLLTGDYPFKGENSNEIRKQINNFNSRIINFDNNNFKEISEDALNFLKKLLELNPFNRPSCINLFEENWLKNFNEQEDKILTSNAFKNAIKNAEYYKKDNKIKNWLIGYIIHHLIKMEDLDYLRKCFLSLDKNFDGKITKEELLIGLKKNMNDEEAEKKVNIIFNNIKNDDENINYNDFIKGTFNMKELLNDKNLSIIFKLIDKDKKGKFNKDELKNFFLSNIQDKEIQNFLDNENNKDKDIFTQFIEELDMNGDGKLNLKEFKQLKKKYT